MQEVQVVANSNPTLLVVLLIVAVVAGVVLFLVHKRIAKIEALTSIADQAAAIANKAKADINKLLD